MIGRKQYAAACAAFAGALVACAPAHAQRALGLDISAWQGNISQTTWNNFRNVENRQFVFLRASRGGTTGFYNQSNSDNDPPTNTFSQRYDDPYFVQNINRATAAGMYAGSYHFSRPDIIASTLNAGGVANTGADEADHFLQMAGAWMRPGYLLPVHDLEAGDGVRTDADMAQFTLDFSNRIYEVMGIRPAIYINGNYASNVLGGASSAVRAELVAKHPTLWIARWPNQSNPNAINVQTGEANASLGSLYGPWDDYGTAQPWDFWQYASTGRLQSFNNGNSNLDFDVARGGVEFLKDQLVPALWTSDASGSWSTLANWNSGRTPTAPVTGPGQVAPVGVQTLPTPRLPGAAGSGVASGQNDTVILDRPNAAIAVELSAGSYNIRKLYAREALNITGGSLTINYVPAADSTPLSAQFSAPVTLAGGALSVHTLQVDATRIFTLGGGSLTIDQLTLMPHASASAAARLLVTGDATLNPRDNAAARIVNGAGAGVSGRVDLGGGVRSLFVGDGAAAVDFTIGVPVVNGQLIKAGPGTLALTGANDLAGDTRVDAGTLILGSAFLNDAADLYLTSGSTVDLNFLGVDAIDELFVDGVLQPDGIYGSLASGVTNPVSFLTGTGTLQVGPIVPPLEAADFNSDTFVDGVDVGVWSGGFGATAGADRSQGDADADGDVDGADFLVWQAQFGAGTVAAFEAPEPGAAVLALIVAGGASKRLRRHAQAGRSRRGAR